METANRRITVIRRIKPAKRYRVPTPARPGFDFVSNSGAPAGTPAWSGQTGRDSTLPFSSEVTTPARINNAPRPARVPSRSPRNKNEVSQANTGSREKINAVCVAGVNCCAQACTENDSARLRNPVIRIPEITGGDHTTAAFSAMGTVMIMSRAAALVWTTAIWRQECFSVACPMKIIWKANITAAPKLSKSPRWMLCRLTVEEDGTVRRYRPTNARAMPSALQRLMARFQITARSTGTSTTATPVRNADFEGVVY